MSTSAPPDAPQQTEEWGPVASGRTRRRWGRRVLVTLLVVLLLLVATGAGAGFYASSRIERVEVAGLTSGSGPTHILVVGSDSRAGLTPEQQAELTAGGDVGERTDTIFVLSVEGGRAALLAFPRDLWVQRCDGSTGRINGAVGIGGPTCMVQTVSALSGLPISHYVAVNFLGFVGIVDAVGGVEVCIDKAIKDPFSGADFQPGCQVLNGREALAFVRVRKVDSDLKRIERQQQFLASLASEIASPSTVLNPVSLYRTAGNVGQALTADEGLGVLGLAKLAWAVRGMAGGGLVSHTVPATPASVGGAAVLIPQEQQAQALFASFRDGSVLGRGGGGVAPADVRVEVLNGAGVEGLAGRTREALEARGYQVVGVGNATVTGTTVVRYAPGQRPAAELLAGDLPVQARLEEDPGLDRVVLVLGQDVAGS